MSNHWEMAAVTKGSGLAISWQLETELAIRGPSDRIPAWLASKWKGKWRWRVLPFNNCHQITIDPSMMHWPHSCSNRHSTGYHSRLCKAQHLQTVSAVYHCESNLINKNTHVHMYYNNKYFQALLFYLYFYFMLFCTSKAKNILHITKL